MVWAAHACYWVGMSYQLHVHVEEQKCVCIPSWGALNDGEQVEEENLVLSDSVCCITIISFSFRYPNSLLFLPAPERRHLMANHEKGD